MKSKIITCVCMVALTSPIFAATPPAPVSSNDVELFSYKLLLAVYNYDYQNLISKQRNAATLFTGVGWQNFQKALTQSQLLQSVKKNQYTVKTVPLAPPDITDQGLESGVYYWKVKIPAMVVYKNDSYQQVQYLDINMKLIYQNQIKAQLFMAKKGKPIHCQKNSSNITVTADKPKKDDMKNKKK